MLVLGKMSWGMELFNQLNLFHQSRDSSSYKESTVDLFWRISAFSNS